ncbi:hypothetical protein BGZ82_009740 [Podila clonocystis]|nr:hypothetical protein BGZ82_009740 [Podila clonocystis]
MAWPIEVLLQAVIQFPGLESVAVGFPMFRTIVGGESSYDPAVYLLRGEIELKVAEAAIRRYGMYISTLKNVYVDREALGLIQRFCPFVTSIDLILGKSFPKLNYWVLEAFLLKMTELTSLFIMIDATLFSPAMLWSVCQARRLRTLKIYVYYSYRDATQEYKPSEFLSVFDCCTHVPEVQVEGSFMAPSCVKSPETYYNWARRKLKVLEFAPADTVEAMARPFSWSSTFSLLKRPSGPCHIRKLKISTEGMHDHDFRSLIVKCPLLEEMDIYMSWLRIVASTWQVLAVRCPNLRVLSIRYGNQGGAIPSSSVLAKMFPNLEELTTGFDCTLRSH